MGRPVTSTSYIGAEHQPLVTIDDFAATPDALRAVAATTPFVAAGDHYPGIRAALPPEYLRDQLPVIARAMGRTFGACRQLRVVDASFSIVTTAIDALTVGQRLPHVDAYGAERIALIHYLAPDDPAGTAFFRHRATRFETVDEARAPIYFPRLDAELRDAATPPAGYIAGDTPLFERIALAGARYNRALLYRSYVLHSGAIPPDASLSPDPARGRLTITAFLAIE